MTNRLYTQEELDARIGEALKDAELADFEDKTKSELKAIAIRLDRANGYKETFGKDIRDIKARLDSTPGGLDPVQQHALPAIIDHAIATRDRRKRWFNSLPYAAAAVTVGSAVGIGFYNAIQFIFTHIR